MPLFGSHVSVAGNLALAVARAQALGCEAFQIFARNPNQWHAPPLDAGHIRAFRNALERAHIGPVVSHASYLPNLAAPDGALRDRSLDTMEDELARADQLGLLGVVFHPGSRGVDDERTGLARVGTALRRLLRERPKPTPRLIIEHTAGQGRCLGHRFEHLAALIELADGSPRVGVCLDTCHLFASGYDIVSPRRYRQAMTEFESKVGLDRLVLLHVNDSKSACGSRVDRHAHIGEGCIGLDAFERLVNDRRFRDLPMLLETEKVPRQRPDDVSPDPLDAMNLSRLRGLLRDARRHPTTRAHDRGPGEGC